MTKQILILIVLTFLILSCKVDKPTNLADAKDVIKEYYESGKIDEEIKLVVDDAINILNEMNINEMSTVVFDIDETTLSGYDYALQLDFGYDWDSWTEWQLQSTAPAVKEVKRLYDYLIDKNVHVIFLTGKRMITYESTYKNLVDVGYTKFDTLICRRDDEHDLKAHEYKTYHRKSLTEAGLNIIMCVGDQDSDLVGEYTGIKVKIPNYLYKIH
jgi:predicted secreted acid phosphatase